MVNSYRDQTSGMQLCPSNGQRYSLPYPTFLSAKVPPNPFTRAVGGPSEFKLTGTRNTV